MPLVVVDLILNYWLGRSAKSLGNIHQHAWVVCDETKVGADVKAGKMGSTLGQVCSTIGGSAYRSLTKSGRWLSGEKGWHLGVFTFGKQTA